MYQFVDTTTTRNVTTELPAEAMSFNGEYLENQIDGYRTLYVRGRESMLAEINAYETGVRDGTGITSKRFPARELVIGYLLRAETNEAFREAYNKLNGILNTQDAQLIFHDEDDKFYTGTPEGLEEVEPGRNFVQGEIIIYCADPFKYSVEEYETEEKSTSFTINYNGTYKAYPTMIANFHSDCGYVAWSFLSDLKNKAKRIELGDSTETEGEYYTHNNNLLLKSFMSSSATWNDWDYDYGGIFIIPNGSSYGLGSGPPTFAKDDDGVQYLTCHSWADSPAGWTGCSVSTEIPADENGDKGSTDWILKWNMILSIGDGGSADTNRGGMEVIVSDSSGSTIAAVVFYKDSAGTTGKIVRYTANQSSTTSNVDFSRNNSKFGKGYNSSGACRMEKSGSTVSFNLGGSSYSLTDSGISSTKAYRVTFVYLRLSDYSYMIEGLYYTEFYKKDVSSYRDVSNTFGKNDKAEVDCGSGTILINGSEDASYGVVENDWETFCLLPGYQNLWFYYSSWVEDPPTTVIKYREVFI